MLKLHMSYVINKSHTCTQSAGSGPGSGSKVEKMANKKRKSKEICCFAVLDVFMRSGGCCYIT